VLEASISVAGEPVPVSKGPGENAVGATINRRGAFKMEARAVGKDTVLAQIMRLAEEAQGSKAPIQRLADSISGWFVPAVIAAAAVVFAGWLTFGTASCVPGAITPALVRAVAMLVIACPCAMGLATPTAVMVATGKGAEMGILFRNDEVLETAGRVTIVAFDDSFHNLVEYPPVGFISTEHAKCRFTNTSANPAAATSASCGRWSRRMRQLNANGAAAGAPSANCRCSPPKAGGKAWRGPPGDPAPGAPAARAGRAGRGEDAARKRNPIRTADDHGLRKRPR
jgi:hypothetical protein